MSESNETTGYNSDLQNKSNFVPKCSHCGITGNFCGFHNLGEERKSLCIACGEAEIDVWLITLAGDPNSGIICKSSKEMGETITSLAVEMDYEDTPYTVSKKKMHRSIVYDLDEFQGF